MSDLQERRKRTLSAFAVYATPTLDVDSKVPKIKDGNLSSKVKFKNPLKNKNSTLNNGTKSKNDLKHEISTPSHQTTTKNDFSTKKSKSLASSMTSKQHASIEAGISPSRRQRRKLKKKQKLLNDQITMGEDSTSSQKLDTAKPQDKERTKCAKDDLTQLHGKDQDSVDKQKENSKGDTKPKKIYTPEMPLPKGNSEKDGQALFEWLIYPLTPKKFFDENWEKKPVLLRRSQINYANGLVLFTTDEFNRILKEHNIRYDVNIDVTTYQEGVRETHNVEGRAFPSVVWDYYNNGCSIRLKNPQSFSAPVWRLCSTLQEYFKSMVGANIYLTPPGTQGFAPHYDDIEAFVLQLEGKKHWSLYDPKSLQETLPRYSSKNFDASEIGSEIFTVTLEPGDLLYFPRGFIHQARSLPDEHSLHITISTYQRNSWGDLLEELVPAALSKAITEDIDFRKGLPRDYLSYLGVQNCDKEHPRRKEMLEQVSSILRRLADYVDVDAAVDARGTSFLHDVLPPVLNEDERKRSIHGASVNLTSPGHPSACEFDITIETKVCVVRKNALRMCVMSEDEEEEEDATIHVYHSVQNSRVYHEEEKKYFDLELEFGPALEYLIDHYPKYLRVADLPLDDDVDKINLATSLFEKGLLLTENQLELIEKAADDQ